jgi:PD-(D/E)XK endonuclease
VELTTDQKGAIAELAITAAAISADVGVYRPMFEGGRYDLIFDVGTRLLRVQCKWAPLHGETVLVRCCSSRRAREGLRRRRYSAGEVDAIAAYCPELDRSFFVPADRFDGHTQLTLRIVPCANNQRLGVNWADDFELDARLRALVGP